MMMIAVETSGVMQHLTIFNLWAGVQEIIIYSFLQQVHLYAGSTCKDDKENDAQLNMLLFHVFLGSNFIFLFLGVVMYDNEFETKETRI